MSWKTLIYVHTGLQQTYLSFENKLGYCLKKIKENQERKKKKG